VGSRSILPLMHEFDLSVNNQDHMPTKKTKVERLNIPNTLNREFDVAVPSQVWCGDITYNWAQGKWRYLAVVLDLCAGRVWAGRWRKPDAYMLIKALEMTYEQRRRPQGLLFQSDQRLQGEFNRSPQHL
jgi:putative transposase